MRGAAGSALTQGIALATGLQDKFSWTGVAVGAVAGAVSRFMGDKLPRVAAGSLAYYGQQIAAGAASAVSGAALRTVLDGGSFGDNVLATLPEVIGSTIGNAFVDQMIVAPVTERERQGGAHGAPVPAEEGPEAFAGTSRLIPDGDIVVTGNRMNWIERRLYDARWGVDRLAPYNPMALTFNLSGYLAQEVGFTGAATHLRNIGSIATGYTREGGRLLVGIIDFNYRAATDPGGTTRAVLGGIADGIDTVIRSNPGDITNAVTARVQSVREGFARGGPEFYEGVGASAFNAQVAVASAVMPAARVSLLGRVSAQAASVERVVVRVEQAAPSRSASSLAAVPSTAATTANSVAAIRHTERVGAIRTTSDHLASARAERAASTSRTAAGTATAAGNISTSFPRLRAIAAGAAELSPRQASVLAQLDGFGTRTIIPKRGFGQSDLAALSAATGDEFAMFTAGGRRLLIRGDATGVPIGIADGSASSLASQGWRWSSHVHSDGSLLSSAGDRAVLSVFGNSRSAILTPTGSRGLFNPDGDLIGPGWLPRGW